MTQDIKIEDLKISCPFCGSDKIEVVFPLAINHPLKNEKEGAPKGALGLANCEGCGREFLAKLPQNIATMVYYRIFRNLDLAYLPRVLSDLGIDDKGLLK